MSGDRKASLSVKKHRQLRKLEIGKVFLATSGSGKPRLEIDLVGEDGQEGESLLLNLAVQDMNQAIRVEILTDTLKSMAKRLSNNGAFGIDIIDIFRLCAFTAEARNGRYNLL